MTAATLIRGVGRLEGGGRAGPARGGATAGKGVPWKEREISLSLTLCVKHAPRSRPEAVKWLPRHFAREEEGSAHLPLCSIFPFCFWSSFIFQSLGTLRRPVGPFRLRPTCKRAGGAAPLAWRGVAEPSRAHLHRNPISNINPPPVPLAGPRSDSPPPHFSLTWK